MKFILGKKIGMTQIFDENGKRIPVTLVAAGPCRVTQVKTADADGYTAIQVGFDQIEPKRVRKTQTKKPFHSIKECRVAANETIKVGDVIDVSNFTEGDAVKVSGITKGKGFQGAVKRHGFKGRHSASHGTKHEFRNVGSVGTSNPDRVAKGRRMPGRMGGERATIKNLKVVKIDAANNILALKGALPGNKGTLLEICG